MDNVQKEKVRSRSRHFAVRTILWSTRAFPVPVSSHLSNRLFVSTSSLSARILFLLSQRGITYWHGKVFHKDGVCGVQLRRSYRRCLAGTFCSMSWVYLVTCAREPIKVVGRRVISNMYQTCKIAPPEEQETLARPGLRYLRTLSRGDILYSHSHHESFPAISASSKETSLGTLIADLDIISVH